MAIGLNKNDYQKYGLIAAGGTFFAIFSLATSNLSSDCAACSASLSY